MKILRFGVLALLTVFLLFGDQIATLYTDLQWFREVGQPGVFTTSLSARLQLFFGFGGLFLIVSGINLWLANRMNVNRPHARLAQPEQEKMAQLARKGVFGALVVAAVALALVVGANAASRWSDYLLYTRAGSFGQTDPLFGRDIGFYVFRLPFQNFLAGWALITLLASAAGVGALYSTHRGLEIAAGGRPVMDLSVRKHLLALAGIAALVVGWLIFLGRYDLLTRDNVIFQGAGYTDVAARLPLITASTFLMFLLGILCFVCMRGRSLAPVVGVGLLWAVVSLLGGAVYPGFIQRFTVIPNQIGKESPYIARSIEHTRKAYGLDKIEVKDLSGAEPISAAEMSAHRTTVNNIRLWDWPQLGAVYTNRQAVRPYYRFQLPDGMSRLTGDFNIDVDRYRINGRVQQVMLGARELFTEGLPSDAQTWQNRHLQYTHGYGAVMSPVNEVDPEGLPRFYLSQIPVSGVTSEVAVTRPQIYYGELTDEFVFVGTSQKEFDYPSETGNRETSYSGKGGSPIGGTFSKLAWSWRLKDTNMLLSGEISESSRVLFRRNIRERVSALAPFLLWDNDPYLVVSNGKLVWIIDGYTRTDQYPYSRASGLSTVEGVERFNYIRNSVKAVIDAYDGTVDFYQTDAEDAIINTWSHIFPGLIKPFDQMPAPLLAHLRYPEDLFRVQRDVYKDYHMTDPRTFYSKEDAWEVPADPTPSEDSEGGKMAPYYVVMRLPDSKDDEFMMISPFTPRSKENLSGWMSAKCDPDDYGKLLVYRFPKGSNVNGPGQIMQLVKRQEDISTFMTLQGQQGSRVIFGNLLVIPMDTELLYALPVYVQAATAGSPLPLISKVIVASGNRVVMQPRLEQAIALLAAGGPAPRVAGGPEETVPRPPGPAASSALPKSTAELLNRATSAYDRARQKQKEYNDSLDELGRALKELQQGAGAAPR
jgi:uncharacterized membrane protein (UPF0182 family)